MNALVADYITATGKMTWIDQFEKRYFNAVYSQQREEDGGFVYNLNVKNGARKYFSADGFYCCNGSGVETHANLCHDICYKKEDQLVITQYIPMEIHLDEQNVTIVQKKDLWEAQSAVFEIQSKEPVSFTLNLRMPGWSKNRKVLINGTEYPDHGKEQVEITRCWENGDKVEVMLPFDINLYSLPDRFEYVAVYYGPFLMAYTGPEKTFDGSKEAFAKAVKEEIAAKTYLPLMEIGEEVYNLFTILPAENKYQTCCELSSNGGNFVSPGENWYIKIDYAPTEEEAVCFDILLNRKVRFTQSFKPKGEDYLAYVLYPVFDCPNTEIVFEIKPKMYEGKHYTDLSVIKKIEIVKKA